MRIDPIRLSKRKILANQMQLFVKEYKIRITQNLCQKSYLMKHLKISQKYLTINERKIHQEMQSLHLTKFSTQSGLKKKTTFGKL